MWRCRSRPCATSLSPRSISSCRSPAGSTAGAVSSRWPRSWATSPRSSARAGWRPRADADLDVEPSAALRVWIAGGAVGAVGGIVLGGPALAVLALAAVGVTVPVALRANRGRGVAHLEAGLPGALEDVARSLRSGGSLRQAIFETAASATSALRRDLSRVVRETEHGSSLVGALDRWAERRPLPGVRLTVAALALGAETGGAQARALD